MAQNAGSAQSTSKLLQIAGLLRIVDRFVREGNYSDAFRFVTKALSIDPSNLYAQAYEERLNILLEGSAKQNRLSSGGSRPDTQPRSFSQFLSSNGRDEFESASKRADSTQPTGAFDPALEFDISPNAAGIGKSAMDHLHLKRSLSLAKALMLENRYDEAMNSLSPAVLVDPMNPEVVSLQKQIRKALQSETSEFRSQDQKQEPANDGGENGRAKTLLACISRSMWLADAGDFAGALATVGRGYLIDPMNEDVANCEHLVLNMMQEKANVDDPRGLKKRVHANDSGTKRELLEHLDRAQELLERDEFGEALSYVMLAMMASPDAERKGPERDSHVQPEATDTFAPAPQPDHRSDAEGEISAKVRGLVHDAQQSADRGDLENAAVILLRAAAMIPANGSLADLDRTIARRYMEYSVLLRSTERSHKSNGSFTREGRKEHSGAPQARNLRQEYISQPSLENSLPPSGGIEQETVPRNQSLNRISEIQNHIFSALGQLNSEKLNEAAASAEAAVSLDDSRSDVKAFAENVAAFAQKVGNRLVLASSYMGSFESLRQQAKAVLYKLFYEQLMVGVDQNLEILPGHERLLTRKADIAEAMEEFNISLAGMEKKSLTVKEESAKTIPATRKTKKHPLEQIDLSFPNELGRRAAQG
jgi:tetratricopeptide (TPR) repeat protein